MRPALFAFLTGLHLALLQFSYFFLLLINITSTYITYALVVLSWMLGTLIGLLWDRVRPTPILVAGVLSYYLIFYLVVSDPLALYTFIAAGLGVAVTGLWAGRFFVVMLPAFARADQLFFHENNGFLVGIAGVFIGFTMLGQPFLLWTPLVSGVVLTGYLLWLLLRPALVRPSPEWSEVPGTGDRLAVIRALALGQADAARAVAGTINLLLPLGLLAHAGLTGEDYWRLFAGEDNAITWFSTLQLLVVAIVAYANYVTIGVARRLGSEPLSRRRWVWLALAVGIAALAVDQRFALHEGLSEALRADGSTAWLPADDPALLLLVLVGLPVAALTLAELRACSAGAHAFVAAVAIALVVALVDQVPESSLRQWTGSRFWSTVFEETGELWSQFLLLCAFLAAWVARLKRLLASCAARPAEPGTRPAGPSGRAEALVPAERVSG